MITAQEARKLYEDSGAKVTDFMKYTVEPMIRNAAESGKDRVFLCAGSDERWKIVHAPVFYQQLIDKLVELGFSAKWTVNGQPTFRVDFLLRDYDYFLFMSTVVL